MLIKQVSLFIENKPGALNAACQVLKENDINIRTLSLADTQQFGILRMLVKEHDKAREVLEKAGFIVKMTDVLALPVSDHPGGLAELLRILDAKKLSVEYMYAFPFGRLDRAVMVFRFEDAEAAQAALEAAGISPLSDFELFA